MTPTASTRRPITLRELDGQRRVSAITTVPAGTRVYVSRSRNGECTVRVPGTLLEQRVPLTALVLA